VDLTHVHPNSFEIVFNRMDLVSSIYIPMDVSCRQRHRMLGGRGALQSDREDRSAFTGGGSLFGSPSHSTVLKETG